MRAMGSAFSIHCPACVRISNLYETPGSTPGTKSSQTPFPSRRRIACCTPSQPLKPPMTRTARACGAQTEKETPQYVCATPQCSRWCAPRTSQRRSWRPSPKR